MKTVDYYFTPTSPWTYLGHERLVALVRRHGATVRVRPVDLGRVFEPSGGVPLARRAPQRQAYRLVELARWRDHVGVPLNIHPKHFPVPADEAGRRIIAADHAYGVDAALALAGAQMRAVWAQDRDVSDAATLEAIERECGLDPARLAAQAHRAAADYDAYTGQAIAAQVFGAPWYVVDGVPFWGQDRIEFVGRALAGG
jgi:2-hydroxychromene-2-carboxylate isomerase